MNIGKLTAVSFGKHFVNVDIGASSINGSLKIGLVDENDNTVLKERTTVFNKGEKRNEDSFEKNVAQKIADFEKNQKELINKIDPDNEAQVVICYPGPAMKNSSFRLTNFYYDNKKTRKFERAINSGNIDSYLKNSEINISQTRHANDMAGAGACLLSKIKKEHQEILEEGKEIIYFYPGGGLGTGIFTVDKDNIKIKPTEIQHIKKHNSANSESQEKDAGAAGLRANYAKALGLSQEEIALLGENTKAVTSYKEAAKIFSGLPKEKHYMASKEATDKFLNSIAQITAIRMCESKTNAIVITGPIAYGIKDAINNNPYYNIETNNGEDKFTTALKAKINESLTSVGKTISDTENLKIIFTKINDNTEGAQLLQKGYEVGNPVSWYNIYR